MGVRASHLRSLLPLWFLMVTKVQDNCYAQRIYADFPDVTPNTAQHFEYQSLYFSCESFDVASGWRVMRKIPGENGSCGMSWGVFNGSLCIVRNIYMEDSGHYWCETVNGKKSNSVNITVTAGAVALESPVLPVMEGDVVTLRCKNKATSSHVSAGFYKNGFLIKNVTTGTLTIHKASKFDEGLYKCYIPGAGESPESWLAVRRKLTFWDAETLCSDQVPVLLYLLMRTVVTVLWAALLLFFMKKRHSKKLRWLTGTEEQLGSGS